MKVEKTDKFLKKFIKNTDTFCVFPWIHISTDTRGFYRLCCKSEHPIFSNDGQETHTSIHSVEEVWNSDHMKSIREDMMNGKKVINCSECYREEKNGKTVSYRQNQNLIQIIDDGNGNLVKQRVESMENYNVSDLPYYLDIKLSAKCNLACIMCHPLNSTSLQNYMNKQIKLGNESVFSDESLEKLNIVNKFNSKSKEISWTDSDVFLKSLDSMDSNIKHLYSTGGEPFIINSLWKKYEDLIEKKLSKNIKLSFCSNLTKISRKKLNILSKFETAEISASLDGYGGTYNFTRWPGNWNLIDRNVNYIIENYQFNGNDYEFGKWRNFNLHFNSAYSTINIMTLPDFVKWIIKLIEKYNEKYKDSAPGISLNQCIGDNEFLNVEYLDKQTKEFLIDFLESKAFDIFNKVESVSFKNLCMQEYLDIITLLKNSKKYVEWKYKKQFWNYIKVRENHTGIKIIDILPKEYYGLLC